MLSGLEQALLQSFFHALQRAEHGGRIDAQQFAGGRKRAASCPREHDAQINGSQLVLHGCNGHL